MLSVNSSLDHVSVVVKQEDDRLQAQPNHRRDLLDRELHASVTDEQDHSSQSQIPSSEGDTQSGADGPTDTAPEDLADEKGLGRKGYVEDAEVGGTSFGDDDIVGFEERPNARPEVALGDHIGLL